MVPLVGLTGGMGAGKSTALELLAELGAEVLSTDAVVHELYGDPRVRDAVVERWGEEVAPGGEVDRAKVAQCAFASDANRAWLEQLLWPLVGERMAQWVEEVRARPAAARASSGSSAETETEEKAETGTGPIANEARVARPVPCAAVVEVPLLFESGMQQAFDATIAVIANERLRSERARGRGHELADERVARQLSQEEKAQLATFTVRNDGNVQDLRRELTAILAKLSE